jgi:riboflavin biosynthesis pyrimidine reductase
VAKLAQGDLRDHLGRGLNVLRGAHVESVWVEGGDTVNCTLH